MNEQEFAGKVVQALNGSVEDLPATTLYKLQAIRQHALARPNAGVLGAAFNWKLAAPAAALMVLCVGYLFMQRQPTPKEILWHEIEAQALTDELPLHAYLDEGFETWLKKTSSN